MAYNVNMKRNHLIASIIPVLLFALLLSIVGLNSASAVSCGGVETSIIQCGEGGDGGVYHILSLLLDILSIGVGILGVVGISWTGIQYLTAGGSEEKIVKSKRRAFEMVIGLACYAILWGFASWLLPGGRLNPENDNSGVEDITISYSNSATVGKTFAPNVTLVGQNVLDRTFSLTSSNTSVARSLGRYVKCIANGTTTITARSANGKTADASIKCTGGSTEGDADSGNTDDGTYSSKNGIASDGSIAASDGSPTVGSQMQTNLKGNPNLRKATREIIADRDKDFYADTYSKVIKSKKYGSYEKYVQSLGGVFAKYKGKGRIKVETAADFQAAAEYVFGLFKIWGVDYSAGGVTLWPDDSAYYANQTDDSRRAGVYHHPGTDSVNTVLKGAGGASSNKSYSTSANINCDKSVVIFKSSISPKKSKNYSSKDWWRSGKKITKVSDLRVGDIVHGPNHVFMVGEVYKDKVVMYDGGSRFQRAKTYKHVVTRTNNSKMDGSYKYSGNWEAYRPWNINQALTLKGIN